MCTWFYADYKSLEKYITRAQKSPLANEIVLTMSRSTVMTGDIRPTDVAAVIASGRSGKMCDTRSHRITKEEIMIKLKNVVAVCLSAAMLFQSFTFTTSFAEEDAVKEMTTKVGDFTFTYIPDLPKKGECTLSAVSDSGETNRIIDHGVLDIPEKLGGYTVTVLGKGLTPITVNMASDRVKLTTVKLPRTIREISSVSLDDIYVTHWIRSISILLISIWLTDHHLDSILH